MSFWLHLYLNWTQPPNLPPPLPLLNFTIKERTRYNKKSYIWETQTLAACVDSSTDKMKFRLFDTFMHFWALYSNLFIHFFCTFLCKTKKIMCHMSQVTCHMTRYNKKSCIWLWHRLSRRVWIVSPINMKSRLFTLFFTYGHPIVIFFFNLFFGFYGTFCEEKIMCNMSHVKGHISHD